MGLFKKALIIGSKGQDGRYLSQQLLAQGWSVIGLDINHCVSSDGNQLAPVDILSPQDVKKFVSVLKPDQIYYLAAHHHSSESDTGDERHLIERSFRINLDGFINILSAVQIVKFKPKIFFAASSHIFGHSSTKTQDENTPLAPTCIYGISKASGLSMCRYFRNKHGMFCSAGILFNHESSLRPPSFVSKKIVQGAVEIFKGKRETITLGGLYNPVDWGYAPDYTQAMQDILSLEEPDDYVVATGILHTPIDWLEIAFGSLSLDWHERVIVDTSFLKKKVPANPLKGNSQKLRKTSGWYPKVNFRTMVEIMLREEVEGV